MQALTGRADVRGTVGRFGCAVLNAIRVVELNANELGVIFNLYVRFDFAESAESAPVKKRSRIFFPLFFSLWLKNGQNLIVAG
jgi:hypothetical protein